MSKDSGGGSLTALPILEILFGDISTYIATNVISITDGQIVLKHDLRNSGYRPAADCGLSVSRIGGKAQHPSIKFMGIIVKDKMNKYMELVERESTIKTSSQDEEGYEKTIREEGEQLEELILRQKKIRSFYEQLLIGYFFVFGFLKEFMPYVARGFCEFFLSEGRSKIVFIKNITINLKLNKINLLHTFYEQSTKETDSDYLTTKINANTIRIAKFEHLTILEYLKYGFPGKLFFNFFFTLYSIKTIKKATPLDYILQNYLLFFKENVLSEMVALHQKEQELTLGAKIYIDWAGETRRIRAISGIYYENNKLIVKYPNRLFLLQRYPYTYKILHEMTLRYAPEFSTLNQAVIRRIYKTRYHEKYPENKEAIRTKINDYIKTIVELISIDDLDLSTALIAQTSTVVQK